MIVFPKNLKFKTQPHIVLFLLFLLPKKKKKKKCKVLHEKLLSLGNLYFPTEDNRELWYVKSDQHNC